MKTLNIYKNTTLALMALTMGLSLVGCAEDSELIYQGAQQLSVKPQILDSKVSRATASDAKLNEEKLIKFNIKMFGEYDECKVDETFTKNLESGKAEVIAKDNWKVEKDLQEGKIYNVKSVANATGTGDVQTDLDIWKPFHATNNGNKTFLMSSIENYKVTNEPNQTIPVSLTRAAAKVILKVHVKVEGYTAGQATWMLKNYNAKTTIFGNNTETDLQDGNVMLAAESGTGEYTITTYSYAMQWKDDTKAPAIYLQVPLTTQVDGVDKTELNLYKIPVRDPKATDANAKTLTIEPNSSLWGAGEDGNGGESILTIMCVIALNESRTYSDTKTIKKQYVQGYTVEIVSSSGRSFQNGTCTTTLTANVYYQGSLVDEEYAMSHFKFQWHRYNAADKSELDFTGVTYPQDNMIVLDYELNASEIITCELFTADAFDYSFPIIF